jgi:ribosomal protein S10
MFFIYERKNTKKSETGGTRIRVKISAYDNRIIDMATKTIIATADATMLK